MSSLGNVAAKWNTNDLARRSRNQRGLNHKDAKVTKKNICSTCRVGTAYR